MFYESFLEDVIYDPEAYIYAENEAAEPKCRLPHSKPPALGMTKKVRGGKWATPAPTSRGGPASLWGMAKREIIHRTGYVPRNKDIRDYMVIISNHVCNKRFLKDGWSKRAFLPKWKKDRRTFHGAGGSYGMVFLPNNIRFFRHIKRVLSRSQR